MMTGGTLICGNAHIPLLITVKKPSKNDDASNGSLGGADRSFETTQAALLSDLAERRGRQYRIG